MIILSPRATDKLTISLTSTILIENLYCSQSKSPSACICFKKTSSDEVADDNIDELQYKKTYWLKIKYKKRNNINVPRF